MLTNRPIPHVLPKRIFPLFLALMLAVPGAWAAKTTKAKPPAKKVATKARPRPAEPTVESWSNGVDRAEDELGERWTVYVKDMQTGRTILDHVKDRRLIPASNRKLMIFALALEKLGPDFKFKTQLGLTRDYGRVGNLLLASAVLRSNGDPTMDARYLGQKNPASVIRGWIQKLAATGVRRLQGDFVIDASAFGAEQDTRPAAWGSDHMNQSYAPLPSALALSQNLLEVAVQPGRVGQEGNIRIFPSVEGLEIVNNTRTVSSRGATIGAGFGEGGGSLVVSGSIGRRNSTEIDHVPVDRPLYYIKAIVQDELRSCGIVVEGKIKIVTNPAEGNKYQITQIIDQHESPELSALLHIMLRDSDNFLAEQIWRATAHRVFGKGDPTTARKLEQDWYNDHSLSRMEPGYDGSGLSRQNHFSALDIVSLLEVLYKSPYRDYLLTCLPCSGKSGTLRHREMGSANGRVVAKTGTLAGTAALSGFMRDRQGHERYAFSMIGNAPTDTNGRLVNRVDALMRILASLMDSGYQPPGTMEADSKQSPQETDKISLKKGGA